MKGNLKKVGFVSLVSVATVFSALGITGCDLSEDSVNFASEVISRDDVTYSDYYINNAFIVYKGKLHKGDVVYYKVASGSTLPDPIIQTDCDMTRVTTEYTFSPDMPHEDEYQFICEDCFPENE